MNDRDVHVIVSAPPSSIECREKECNNGESYKNDKTSSEIMTVSTLPITQPTNTTNLAITPPTTTSTTSVSAPSPTINAAKLKDEEKKIQMVIVSFNANYTHNVLIMLHTMEITC